MKLNILLSCILIFAACQKNNYLENEKDSLYNIERTESSRSGSYTIGLNKHIIYLIQNENDTLNKRNVKNEWSEINNLMNGISLSKIEEIKSPSQSFMYDGATATSIKFNISDTIFYTNTYDKRNPAVDLKKLDDYLTKLSESLHNHFQ